MDPTGSPRSHFISEAISDRVSRTKEKNHYKFKSEFETRRDKLVDQFFWRQNDPMSRPPLDSTPLGTNTTNGTTSPSDSIPVGTKCPKPTSPALPTYLPWDPDPDPIFSDSSRKYNSSNDSHSNKLKKKKLDKKKKHRKDNKR